jgi:hypothetical protein
MLLANNPEDQKPFLGYFTQQRHKCETLLESTVTLQTPLLANEVPALAQANL